MTKRILSKAEEEWISAVRGDRLVVANINVTPSCGCVFCDLGLIPDADNVHRSDNHPDVKCRVAI